MDDKIVMRDSTEAAKFVTGLSGWVSRTGHFYGASEDMARYDGCTHVACKECGEPVVKSWLTCQKCRDKKALKRYQAMPKKQWDGEAMLYSEASGNYFWSLEDAEDSLEEEGATLESLRLVICEPTYPHGIDSDYWADDLPEDSDGYLPDIMEKAIEAFNEAIKSCPPLSWSPGDFALDLDTPCSP